jgi:hypothetical protein
MKVKELFEEHSQYAIKYNDGKIYKYYKTEKEAEEDFDKLKNKKMSLWKLKHFADKGFLWRQVK